MEIKSLASKGTIDGTQEQRGLNKLHSETRPSVSR
jgi:hypothetical protein